MLIHIGYFKTGTTWLQRHLFRAEYGSFDSPVPRSEVRRWLILPHDLEFDGQRAREAVLTAVAQKAGNLVPVISVERLAGTAYSGGYDSRTLADRLYAAIPEARILIVIREQTSMILSTYREFVKAGGATSLSGYLDPPRRDRALVPLFRYSYFAYDALVSYYQQLFGDGRVLVLPFERLRSDVDGFAVEIVRFAGASSPRPLPRAPVNVGVGAPALALKRWLNMLLVRNTINPAAFVDSRVVRKGLERATYLADRLTPPSLRTALESRWRRTIECEVGSRYEESNRKTAKLTGIDLESFGYPC